MWIGAVLDGLPPEQRVAWAASCCLWCATLAIALKHWLEQREGRAGARSKSAAEKPN